MSRSTVMGLLAVLGAGLLLGLSSIGQVRADDDEQDPLITFNELFRRYKELERNRDYLKEKERGEILLDVGELDLSLSEKSERLREAVGKFLLMALTNDPSQRVKIRAMMALGRLSDLKFTQALWKYGEGQIRKESLYLERVPEAMAGTTDDDSAHWILTKKLLSSRALLRQLAAEALGYMKYQPAVESLVQLLAKEKVFEVRYEAVTALGSIGDPSAAECLMGLVADPDHRMREAAAFSLGEVNAVQALGHLHTLMQEDTEPLVRESAVLAIHKLGQEESVDHLIRALSPEPLVRIKERITTALRDLTGGKMTAYDTDLWRSWWEINKIKDPEERAREEEIPEGQRSVVKYYDLEVLSNRVVFIVDVSCSMGWAERPENQGANAPRITRMKKEFNNTMDVLPGETLFDVVRFASDHRPWSREVLKKERGRASNQLIDATPKHKQMARDWVQGQLPGGGTNTYETIVAAFHDYPDADTIYFMSDGAPSLGKYKLQEKILAEFKKLNRYRRVQIHCIALLLDKAPSDWGESVAIVDDKEVCIDFMRRLAAENRGSLSLILDDDEYQEFLDDGTISKEEFERATGKSSEDPFKIPDIDDLDDDDDKDKPEDEPGNGEPGDGGDEPGDGGSGGGEPEEE